MKTKVFLIADTETTGVGRKAIVFDLAYVIATRKKIITERSFLVRETITSPRVMFSAIADKHWRECFGGKLFRHYIPGLHDNSLRLHSWYEILQIMRDDILTYGVDVFTAYNINFDLGAMNKTHNLIASKNLNFDRLALLDLWLFSCMTVCNTKGYHSAAKQFGEATGWITEAGNVRTNAEKTYAYLTGNFDFVESHTALEDARIETDILQRLLARKRTIPYNDIQHMPWRIAQKNFDKM